MTQKPQDNRKETSSTKRILQLCKRSVAYQTTDPEASLWMARKTGEAICRYLFIEKISPNPRNIMLDKMIEMLSQDVLPKHVQVAFRTIQHYGNLGVHEQDDGNAEITPQYVTACIASLETIVNWFFGDWLDEKDFDIAKRLQSKGNKHRPMTDLIVGSLETTLPYQSAFSANKLSSDTIHIERMNEFWEKLVHKLKDGTRISIDGSLSQFAPLLVGNPRIKRELHHGFRKAISGSMSEKERADINSKLAYTAGQMVIRRQESDDEWVYLGLYHAIVRNSIPVFVSQDYYKEVVEKIYVGHGKTTFDAHIEGYIKQAPSSLKKSLFQQHSADRLISPRLMENATQPIRCIFVDGNDSKISYISPTKYLDGDIWVAIEVDGAEYFRSRFCDLSDMNDVELEARLLSDEIEKEFGNSDYRLLLQFDSQLTILKYESTEISSIKDLL